jgi:N-acetylglutamate synthase-like GNAT family acetyltransferase
MIQFRPYTEKTSESILAMLTAFEIDHAMIDQLMHANNRFFVVDDGDAIIGFCTYAFVTPELAHIMAIFIVPSERKNKFGDGLFRAVLNSIEINGGMHVILSGSQTELDFYAHEGLSPVALNREGLSAEVHSAIEPLQHETFSYLESIEKYFKKPCKGQHKN